MGKNLRVTIKEERGMRTSVLWTRYTQDKLGFEIRGHSLGGQMFICRMLEEWEPDDECDQYRFGKIDEMGLLPYEVAYLLDTVQDKGMEAAHTFLKSLNR